ncbi:Uncharacterised protein [Coprococcus eutactus]|mgnify:FL=1|nr:Uncharacterised protein [Coprococcus eutactus]
MSLIQKTAPRFDKEANICGMMYDNGLAELLECDGFPDDKDIESCKRKLLEVFSEVQVNSMVEAVLESREKDKESNINEIDEEQDQSLEPNVNEGKESAASSVTSKIALAIVCILVVVVVNMVVRLNIKMANDLKQNTVSESEYDDNQIVGCIVHAGEYTYINQNGVVIETSTNEIYDDVLCIYGVHVESVQTGYKLNTEDATVLNDILTVLQLINKYDMQFDRVRYEFGFVLYRNGIRIIMGNIDGFEFKLRHLGAILSELEGKKGNLDMSQYNESNCNVIFKVNKEE